MTDLTGKTFKRLTVIGLGERRSKGGRPYWLCKCECGTEKEVICDSLTGGKTMSCGCLQKELLEQYRARKSFK